MQYALSTEPLTNKQNHSLYTFWQSPVLETFYKPDSDLFLVIVYSNIIAVYMLLNFSDSIINFFFFF